MIIDGAFFFFFFLFFFFSYFYFYFYFCCCFPLSFSPIQIQATKTVIFVSNQTQQKHPKKERTCLCPTLSCIKLSHKPNHHPPAAAVNSTDHQSTHRAGSGQTQATVDNGKWQNPRAFIKEEIKHQHRCCGVWYSTVL